MTRPAAAEHLLRLRWRLTVLFTLMNTAGLVIFAWLVIGLDAANGERELDGSLRRVTSTVLRLVENSGGQSVATHRINADPIDRDCPQFYVLPGGDEVWLGHQSQQNCVQVDLAIPTRLARESAATGQRMSGNVRDTDGSLLRVDVEPFRESNDGPFTGAVVAVADAEAEAGRHQRVMLVVLGGCILLVVGVAIGGHLLAGRAIQPAAAALQQQETLLAETAHDLRTPVAALRALAETAAGNPQQRTELLPRTVRLAARMGDIIDGLLVRARLAAGVERLEIQPIWLDQLVGGVLEDTNAEGAAITLVAARTRVDADPTLVRRAINNLIQNALRHGRVPGQQAVVTVTVGGGRVTVADRGPGIDPERAEQIFDRFTSGGDSSGLGLAIVRWVAEAHGGMLSVYNADEGGAIFDFALPFSDPGPAGR